MSFALVHASAVLALALVVGAAACGGSSKGPTDPAPHATGGAVEEEPAEPTEVGATLDILADEPTPVLLDGKPIGKAPLTGYKVEPGSHDVTFVDERRGNRTMVVTVAPNETQTVKADNPPTKFVAPQDAEDGKK